MSRIFQKALRLPLAQKLRFAQVTLLMAVVHASLRVFPFSRLYRFIKRFHKMPARHADTAAAAGICWAVNRAGDLWYRDNGCLVQALVGEMLLVRTGVPARLVIGVQKTPAGSLLAHAWVESDGRIVIGGSSGPGVKNFKDFPNLHEVIG